MKWEMKEARYGDIVRVALGSIYHFGIFVSEDEVIQFGLPPTTGRSTEDVEVLSAPVSDFLAGGFLEVGCPEGIEKKRRRSPEQTVASARARLGERGYNVIHNNCEHFVNECAFGQSVCTLADSIRERVRAFPVVHVYVAAIPFPVDEEKIYPAARAKEIAGCSHEGVRKKKYFVWKLLESSLLRTFGLKLSKLNIKKNKSGKWECAECCFSLSHCGDLVAVALSRKPVGVDIERADAARFNEAIAEKIATEREREGLAGVPQAERGEAVNILWTQKEAVFKAYGSGGFNPVKTETTNRTTVSKRLSCGGSCGGENYFITVASEDAAKAIFRGTDGLEFTDV